MKNHRFLSLILVVLGYLPYQPVHADTTALTAASTGNDIYTYVDEISRKRFSDNPDPHASPNTAPKVVIGTLKDVTHKALIESMYIAYNQPPGDDWKTQNITNSFISLGIWELFTPDDIPELLSEHVPDNHYYTRQKFLAIIRAKGWGNDPHMTAYLLTRMGEYQNQPNLRDLSDSSYLEVLRMASKNPDPNVMLQFAITVKKIQDSQTPPDRIRQITEFAKTKPMVPTVPTSHVPVTSAPPTFLPAMPNKEEKPITPALIAPSPSVVPVAFIPYPCIIIAAEPLEAYDSAGSMTGVNKAIIGAHYQCLTIDGGKAVLQDAKGATFRIRNSAIRESPAIEGQ